LIDFVVEHVASVTQKEINRFAFSLIVSMKEIDDNNQSRLIDLA